MPQWLLFWPLVRIWATPCGLPKRPGEGLRYSPIFAPLYLETNKGSSQWKGCSHRKAELRSRLNFYWGKRFCLIGKGRRCSWWSCALRKNRSVWKLRMWIWLHIKVGAFQHQRNLPQVIPLRFWILRELHPTSVGFLFFTLFIILSLHLQN